LDQILRHPDDAAVSAVGRAGAHRLLHDKARRAPEDPFQGMSRLLRESTITRQGKSMTLNVHLAREDGGKKTLTALDNVVFEGGEPALLALVRFALNGEEMVGRIVTIEPGIIIVERIDDAILTEDPGIEFVGEPGHATPATDTLDLTVPRHR